MISLNTVRLNQNQHNSSTGYKFNDTQMLNKKTALRDSFESSQKQVRFKGLFGKIFKSLDDKFAKPSTLEELQQLAKEAHYYERPLGNALYRGDFKGIVSKAKIIEILEVERDKADMGGTRDRFQRYIDMIKKEYQS
ncbi:MAG: hypothetical protein PHC34_10690 [Candidatus Gastranaerophilales bacterium]|nr:hypothetical protein [Candidatus Gastranaerophilales bacterium]